MSRETPNQSRAKNSVNCIIEAAIQLLDADETSCFTTNHIAKRAGVSIGTIYRYFPDKRSILRAIAMREVVTYSQVINNVIDSSTETDPEAFLLEIMAIEMEAFETRPKATHNIRKLARKDDELMVDVQQARWNHTKRIYDRLRVLEPERFPPLSHAEIVAGCEAYLTAMIALSEGIDDREVDLATRARLALQFYEALPVPVE